MTAVALAVAALGAAPAAHAGPYCPPEAVGVLCVEENPTFVCLPDGSCLAAHGSVVTTDPLADVTVPGLTAGCRAGGVLQDGRFFVTGSAFAPGAVRIDLDCGLLLNLNPTPLPHWSTNGGVLTDYTSPHVPTATTSAKVCVANVTATWANGTTTTLHENCPLVG
jgi:hypothetical protein